MQGTRFQITTKTDAQRNDVVSRVDKTLMNHVEAARSSCGISPDVRGMWGIVRDVLVNVARHASLSPIFINPCGGIFAAALPNCARLIAGSLSVGRRDSINTPSELVGIWNQHPRR